MNDPFPPPSPDQHRRFLISFLFGGEMDPGLRGCVARAYLDLARTAHRIGAAEKANELKRSAHVLVETLAAKALSNDRWVTTSFDAWHQASCSSLREHYAGGGYSQFTIGQAQKWLNMALKYALSLAELQMLDVAPIASVRSVAHVPLDSYILSALASYNAPRLPNAWSRLADYGQYLQFQHWIRTHFPESTPLDVEFHLWLQENARRRTSVSA